MSKRTDELRRIARDMGASIDGLLVREAADYIEGAESALNQYQRAYGLIEEDGPDYRTPVQPGYVSPECIANSGPSSTADARSGEQK